jgi:hypothetical protein
MLRIDFFSRARIARWPSHLHIAPECCRRLLRSSCSTIDNCNDFIICQILRCIFVMTLRIMLAASIKLHPSRAFRSRPAIHPQRSHRSLQQRKLRAAIPFSSLFRWRFILELIFSDSFVFDSARPAPPLPALVIAADRSTLSWALISSSSELDGNDFTHSSQSEPYQNHKETFRVRVIIGNDKGCSRAADRSLHLFIPYIINTKLKLKL